MAFIKRYTAVLFEVYFFIRPLDWLFIISAFKNKRLSVSRPHLIFLIWAIFIGVLDLNTSILFVFGFVVIWASNSIFRDRTELINALMAGAKLIGSVLIVDVLLTLVLGLDLKSSFGIPNENYEADYLRFSGIFTESALYGPVLFLLLFPLTVDKEIVLAHHKTLLIYLPPDSLHFQ